MDKSFQCLHEFVKVLSLHRRTVIITASTGKSPVLDDALLRVAKPVFDVELAAPGADRVLRFRLAKIRH